MRAIKRFHTTQENKKRKQLTCNGKIEIKKKSRPHFPNN